LHAIIPGESIAACDWNSPFASGGTAVKVSIVALFATTLFLAAPLAGPALANNDEDAQIAQCVDDNSDAGQSEDTLETYCQCASGKMNDFGASVTAWEKQHADEQETCSKQAGWKY
jgi:hypothetical protein